MLASNSLDAAIAQRLNPRFLRWPSRDEVCDEAAPVGNRAYNDLRRLSWREASRVWTLEGKLIERIERAENPATEAETIEDEMFEGDADLFGLDLGVASSVVALSAARCIPVTSCNAGAFGGGHLESYPLVGFFMRRQFADAILGAAVEAGVGLENHDDGSVIAYAVGVKHLRTFAKALLNRRKILNAIRLRSNSVTGRAVGRQLNLWPRDRGPSAS